MPTSSPKNEQADRAQLARRVEVMEATIDHLKNKLNDHTQLDSLMERVSNCETLAGIASSNSPSVKGE